MQPSAEAPSPNGMHEEAHERIDVTAWFVLHNTGTQDEEMEAAFPLDSINTFYNNRNKIPGSNGLVNLFVVDNSFTVTSDGVFLPVEYKEIAMDDGLALIDVTWATFNAKFPTGKDVLIKVNYALTSWGSGINWCFNMSWKQGPVGRDPSSKLISL